MTATITAAEMAALHATAFDGAARWSEASFAAMRADPACFELGDTRAFALGRIAADEAELLTLVTTSAHRRCGHARRLLDAFDVEARAGGATTAFLEVAEDNAAARALYAGAGWREAGCRRGYYAGIDALILRKDI